ncbi:MAG: VPLPA-CTERM sorting domain-containing protein [Methylovulum sp.]|nr:VPLPA-CTERM sorting domain-containing protein [Methylovulum sp.]
MKFKLLMMPGLLALNLLSVGANAATFSPLTVTTGSGNNITYNGVSYHFEPSTTPPIMGVYGWDGGNLMPQNPAIVGSAINTAFGIATIFKQQANLVNNNSLQSISTTEAYNYLAVHVGGGELLFRFYDTFNGPFKIQKTDGTGGGLSNYRSYLGPEIHAPTATPVPAAVWLFGSGLVGLIGIRRKSKTALSA